jgi:hypothetical protein
MLGDAPIGTQILARASQCQIIPSGSAARASASGCLLAIDTAPVPGLSSFAGAQGSV